MADKDVLARAILSNRITSAQLNSHIAAGDGKRAWAQIVKSKYLGTMLKKEDALNIVFGSGNAIESIIAINGAEIAASDAATEAVCKSGSSLLTIVSNEDYLNLWNDVPANKTRLFNQINAVDSKLVRQTFTASGTLVIPAEGILALSYFGCGRGGSGGNASGSYSGSGGGGGESKFGMITSSLPTSDVAVTLSGATSFLSVSIAAGGSGSASATGGSGGGSTSGDTCYDPILDHIFQIKTGSRIGGVGGGGVSSNGAGNAGSAGLYGSGGSGGTYSGTTATGGFGGTGFGSGGGSGGKGSNYGSAAQTGQGYGCGGGGGYWYTYHYGTGAVGSNGYLSVTMIKA